MKLDGKIYSVEAGRSVLYFIPEKGTDSLNNPFTPHQEKVVVHAKIPGHTTHRKITDLIGISIRTASRDLTNLVNRGILVPDGNSGRLAGYLLTCTNSKIGQEKCESHTIRFQ